MLLLCVFLPAAAAAAPAFDGYIAYAGQNISQSNDASTNQGCVYSPMCTGCTATPYLPSTCQCGCVGAHSQCCCLGGLPHPCIPCAGPTGPVWTGSNKFTVMKTMCDASSTCQFFNDASLKHWLADPNANSYISTTRCANSTTGNVVSGGCNPTGAKNTQYLNCTGIIGKFVPFATFALPPFLIAQACDKNEHCSAFVVDAAGSTGSLFSHHHSGSPSDRYYLRLPSKSSAGTTFTTAASPRRRMISSRTYSPGPTTGNFLHVSSRTYSPGPTTGNFLHVEQRTCHSISPQATDSWCTLNCNKEPPNCPASLCACWTPSPTPTPTTPSPTTPSPTTPSPTTPKPTPAPTYPAFFEFDGMNIGALGSYSLLYGPCEPAPPQTFDPSYNASFMTTPAQAIACNVSLATCDSFIDTPHMDAGGQGVYSQMKFGQDASMNSYIASSICVPSHADCGVPVLMCVGLNTTVVPIAMETYDLPLALLRQACETKSCDAFTSAVNGSGGTLFQFQPSQGAAVGYLRSPNVWLN